jgi:hypothetical protein
MSLFSDRLAALGFASYDDYLASNHWKQFKEVYRSSGLSLVCAVCGCKPVQLHHTTYVRLGSELPTDVTPLCREHHKDVHEWLKTNASMVNATHKAIKDLIGRIVNTLALAAPVVRKPKPPQISAAKKKRTERRRERKALREANIVTNRAKCLREIRHNEDKAAAARALRDYRNAPRHPALPPIVQTVRCHSASKLRKRCVGRKCQKCDKVIICTKKEFKKHKMKCG